MSKTGKKTLNDKQLRTLDAMLTGLRLKDVARAAGIAERTVYKYLDLPHFKAELRRREAILTNEHTVNLTVELASNRALMIRARDDEEAGYGVRLRAAVELENSLLRWKQHGEIEARIAELESTINA